MISKRNITRAMLIPYLLILIYSPIVGVGFGKTIPIVVRAVMSESQVPANWSPTEIKDTFEQMQKDLEGAIVGYFGDFWEVVPDHTTDTKVTVTVTLVKKGLPGFHTYYYRVKHLVERHWSDGTVTARPYRPIPDCTWCDPAIINLVEMTPPNVATAFKQFLDAEYPDNSDVQEKSLKAFMERAPVAVDASRAGDGSNTWLLPFPNEPRYEIFEFKTFKLCTRHWGHPCEHLIVEGTGERLDNSEDAEEPLKALLKGVPDPFNMYEYDGAFIFMSADHFDIDTY